MLHDAGRGVGHGYLRARNYGAGGVGDGANDAPTAAHTKIASNIMARRAK